MKNQAVAEVKLSYVQKVDPMRLPKITCSGDANDVLRNCWDDDEIDHRESFVILLMNRQNRVLAFKEISKGGVSGTVCDPKLVFQVALKTNAAAIILAHNHPSGNLQASHADKSLTKKLTEAGKFLDLPVLDHLIISRFGYYSFSDEGEL